MFTIDTSVIVAGLASWHERHHDAAELLRRRPRLVGHCIVESYSVLTRLPEPQRIAASSVAQLLSAALREPPMQAPDDVLRGIPARFAELSIIGGATYDALIAITAMSFDVELITLDRRAETTYNKVGVKVRSL